MLTSDCGEEPLLHLYSVPKRTHRVFLKMTSPVQPLATKLSVPMNEYLLRLYGLIPALINTRGI